MNRILYAVLAGVGLTAASVVYAHCGRCAKDAAKMAETMKAGNLTLAKAIEIAEKHSKGVALAAHVEMEDKEGFEIEVICLVGDKIMECEIDKTGKVVEMEEEKLLPADDEDEPGKDDDQDDDHKHDHGKPGHKH